MHNAAHGSAAAAIAKQAKHSNSPAAVIASKMPQSWWVVGQRAVAVGALFVTILLLPQTTLATLLMMFAGYAAAHGVLAILIGLLAVRRGAYWQAFVLEGAIYLGVAAADCHEPPGNAQFLHQHRLEPCAWLLNRWPAALHTNALVAHTNAPVARRACCPTPLFIVNRMQVGLQFRNGYDPSPRHA